VPVANAPLKQQSRITTCRQALVELVEQPPGLHTGRGETLLQGVGGGEVQPAAGIDEAVAGQVHQRQVVRPAPGQELLHREPDLVGAPVEHRGDVEPAEVGATENLPEVGRVARR